MDSEPEIARDSRLDVLEADLLEQSEPEFTGKARERFDLLLREGEEIARVARRLAGNPNDAEDLVQEVMLRVPRHPTGPRDEDCFRAWCYGLLRNTG